MEIRKDQSIQQSDSQSTSSSPIVRRRSRMDSIRSSLKAIPLYSQNHQLAQTKFTKRKGTINPFENQEEEESCPESLETHFSVSKLFDDKYEIMEKIGEGTSGVVHRCIKRATKEVFAVKSFSFEEEHIPSLKTNFFIQQNLDHPNVVKYQALYLDMKKHLCWLVMQFIEWPSLNKVTLEGEDEMRVIMQQLLEALNYLHMKDIAHRDIKPQNILYNKFTQTIKLIDFGISRRYKRRQALFDMWTITGTLYFRAPEMFSGCYRQGVDVWAAGVLLYKLVSGHTPFQSEYHNQTIKKIIESDLRFCPKFQTFNEKLESFLRRILNKNPDERPSACTLLKDVWFYSIPSHFSQHTGSLKVIQDEECNRILQKPKFYKPQTFESLKLIPLQENSEKRDRQITREQLEFPDSTYRQKKGKDFFFVDEADDKKPLKSEELGFRCRQRKTLPLF